MFDPKSTYGTFLVDKVALGRILLRVLRFTLSVSSPQSSILNFTYVLLLTEKQMDEAWGPSKKERSFGNGGAEDIKKYIISLFPSLKG